MKFNTLSRRAAAAGAVTALAGGALVATATTATASTQPATNGYSCVAPTQSGPQTFSISVTSSAPSLAGFPQFAAGATIPAAVTVSNHFVIPTQVKQLFQMSGVDNVTLPDMGAVFSGTNVKVDESGLPQEDGSVAPMPIAQVSNMTPVSGNDLASEFDADGQNKSLNAPKAGTYQLLMPTSFHVNANNAEGTLLTQATCTLLGDANSLHEIQLVKTASTINAKSAKTSFKKGKPATVNVTVLGVNQTPSGTVLLKNKAGKTLDKAKLNNKGKAALVTSKLPVGKNALTTVYKGDGYNNKGTDKVTVKVVK
jgi:hypothetical protein